jgi:hypothetical protein
MSIEGSVRTLPAADLLEWLGRSGRTGSVTFGRGRLIRGLGVDRGHLAWASSNRTGDALSQILRARGIIDETGLEAAAAREVETGCMLGQALVDTEVLSADEVCSYLANQVREAVCDVVSWPEGWFRFVPEVRERRSRLGIELPIADLLAVAVPALSGWRALSQIWLEGGEVARAPGSGSRSGPLLDLIDDLGPRVPIYAIITQAPTERFETLSGLAALAADGTVIGAAQHEQLKASLRAAEVAELSRSLLGSYRVPRRLEIDEEPELTEEERYLLGRVDGCWDLFSLVSSSALGEIETLVTFKRLSERGVIAL